MQDMGSLTAPGAWRKPVLGPPRAPSQYSLLTACAAKETQLCHQLVKNTYLKFPVASPDPRFRVSHKSLPDV